MTETALAGCNTVALEDCTGVHSFEAVRALADALTNRVVPLSLADVMALLGEEGERESEGSQDAEVRVQALFDCGFMPFGTF